MKLQEAVATVTEMFHEVGDIAHPYTESHIRELGRRCHRIGASLSGEDANRFQAIVGIGMTAIAEVGKRNAVDTIEFVDGQFTTVAGFAPLSGTPRWEERMESLEFALSSFGIEGERIGDSAIAVKGFRATAKKTDANMYTYGLTPKDVIHKHLPAQYPMKLTRSDIGIVHEAVPDSAFFKRIEANREVKISRADMELLLAGLLDVESDEAFSLRTAILDTIGIEEV
jgi:hypothetical protein